MKRHGCAERNHKFLGIAIKAVFPVLPWDNCECMALRAGDRFGNNVAAFNVLSGNNS